MNKRIQGNIDILQQGKTLLQNLDDAAYQHCSENVFNSSVGSHVRHNLDHYSNFLKGIKTGKINYDNRQRDLLIETKRIAAINLINEICNHLNTLDEPAKPLQIWLADTESLDGKWITTTVLRELEFLMSHTIHHYAIITIMCRLEGLAVEKGFGIAPSTLRYWAESNNQCAH